MKLTAAKRKRIPKSEFAGPGRSFPLTDKVHDRMAISGATRSERAGNISAATADRIKAKARKKLGISPKGESTSRRGLKSHVRGDVESYSFDRRAQRRG